MPKLVSLVKYWAPVIAWMLLIFVASGDLMSAEHTSRFLIPFLLWIAPGISPATIASTQLLMRKSAHLTEYAILAVLLWRGIHQRQAGSWRAAVIALVAAALYASFDEFHQSFIPSRTGTPRDVVIDCCGAILGLAIASSWSRRRARDSNLKS
jgi:VanZ family protein